MIIYILKFSACLSVFMVFYKLLLEKESFHTFKRYYLLAILILAASIPLITFTTYVDTVPIQSFMNNPEMVTSSDALEYNFESAINYWPILLWSIYLIGVLVFTIRFGLNLSNIVKRINKNPKFKNQSIYHVLLSDMLPPHTFLNYIFFNKEKYEANEIPTEVLFHEETHAKEKHALDIIFLEILQIIFWFNPLLYLIKKDIKLNHEFLADRAVISNGVELKNYQNTLLAFSSSANEPQLANAINYSSIKKRFTVMKTKTSQHIIWIRSLILLPLLAILIYSFSENNIVEKNTDSAISGANHSARSIEIEVLKNGVYKIDNYQATKETFKSVIYLLHQDVTSEIRNQIINVHVNSGNLVTDEEVWFIYNSFLDYGFHRILTCNQEIVRAKGNKPLAIANTIKIESDKNSEIQKGASKEQIAEYNKLAKYYNSQKGSENEIKFSDMKRLKYLYNLMSAEQKKQAEPFPNFPPPPPVQESQKNISTPPPPPPPVPANATPEQKEKYKKISEDYYKKHKVEHGKVTRKVPPPPPPKSPLDHIIKMAKKDGVFYYEGNKISSDKAINLLKNDSELNISTKNGNSKNPIVHITSNPVITNKNGEVITKVDTLSEIENNKSNDKVGYVRIKNTVYYYSIKDNKISYFNRWGERVDREGQIIKTK
mgnify:CR=1 FL=1